MTISSVRGRGFGHRASGIVQITRRIMQKSWGPAYLQKCRVDRTADIYTSDDCEGPDGCVTMTPK
jgi:hypothetical protein